MAKNFIILNLADTTAKRPVFWRANDQGYTIYPFAAGIYTEERVKANPMYYNDGIKTIAIELSDDALFKCGLKYSIDIKKLKEFVGKNKTQSGL